MSGSSSSAGQQAAPASSNGRGGGCDQADDELAELGALLGRLDLRPVDQATAKPATALGASHRLRAADAVHLATAVAAGAERFLANNKADFPRTITEVDVPYPKDLR